MIYVQKQRTPGAKNVLGYSHLSNQPNSCEVPGKQNNEGHSEILFATIWNFNISIIPSGGR